LIADESLDIVFVGQIQALSSTRMVQLLLRLIILSRVEVKIEWNPAKTKPATMADDNPRLSQWTPELLNPATAKH
jgi:hypothetical protein